MKIVNIAKFNKLNTREQLVIIIGGVISFFLIITTFIIKPAIDKANRLDKQIIQKRDAIKKIAELKEVYAKQVETINTINSKLETGKKDFPILSFLEDTARQVGIKEKIVEMKPFEASVGEQYKESSVELKVDGITMNQLVEYLYKIEHSDKILNIKKLKLKKMAKNEQFIDVKFEVATFEIKEGAENANPSIQSPR